MNQLDTVIRLTSDFDNIHFWPHCKLFNAKNFARDGVHMSAIGMKKYVNSMRKVAIHAKSEAGLAAFRMLQQTFSSFIIIYIY